jgi:fatty-acid desaturase
VQAKPSQAGKDIDQFIGTQAFEGSVFWWVIDHRDHHCYTDTELDP